MIAPLLLLCPTATDLPVLVQPAADEEFERRFEVAGEDLDELWDLVLWCEDTDREKEARRVLRRVVRLHPDHRRAHERLGDLLYDGRWFTGKKSLEEYKQEQLDQRSRELGLVKHRGRWVHPDELPFLKRGLVKDPKGRWVTKREQARLAKGWARQDLQWIPPREVAKIEQGLWSCDGKWLSLEEANRWHQHTDRCWEIPSEHLLLRTTCERATAEKATTEMESGFGEMVRIFGRAPVIPIAVLVTRTKGQLEQLCKASEARPSIDGLRLIQSLRTIFAESWYDRGSKSWRGSGACWWDVETEGSNRLGAHAARMAMGLAFVDAMDPSPKAVEKTGRRGIYEGFVEEYYREKKLPRWFRWGAACYASRYYEDREGDGLDAWWPRKWSIDNIKRQGGLILLDPVFEFEIAWNNPDSSKLVIEAGLLVAFMLDGGCEPLQELHAEFQGALSRGEDTGTIFERIREEIEKHEGELRAFAGL